MKLVMAKRGGGMGMGGRGGGMQFGKIGLKLDRMNLHALADRQNEEVDEEVGRIFVSLGHIIISLAGKHSRQTTGKLWVIWKEGTSTKTSFQANE